MSIAIFPPTSFDPPQFPVRRFTVEEYHRLGEVGVLTEDDRVELIEGLVVPKMNRSPLHDVSLSMLQKRLASLLPASWDLRTQMAITTAVVNQSRISPSFAGRWSATSIIIRVPMK